MKKIIVAVLCLLSVALVATAINAAPAREPRCVRETKGEHDRITRDRPADENGSCADEGGDGGQNDDGDAGDPETPPTPQTDLRVSLAGSDIPDYIVPGSTSVPLSSVVLDASHSDKDVVIKQIEFLFSATSATHGARLENCVLTRNNSPLNHSGRYSATTSVFDDGVFLTNGKTGFTFPSGQLTIPSHESAKIALICDLLPEFEGVLTIGITEEEFIAEDPSGHGIDHSFGTPKNHSIGVGVTVPPDNNPPTDNPGDDDGGDSGSNTGDPREKDREQKPEKPDRDDRR